MRNIYVDCGAHKAEFVKNFPLLCEKNQYNKVFEIFAFEPLPILQKYFNNLSNVSFSNKAIWISDGEYDFYEDFKRKKWGSTLIWEKTSGSFVKDRPLKVQCIDFSKWIIDNFSKDDFIIVKIDIEGAEYKVLDKMMADKSIEYINELYVEWHWDRMGMSKEQHLDFIKKLSLFNVKIYGELSKYITKSV
jgi:FkbM family methyltransferase